MVASSNGHLDVARVLIEAQANINQRAKVKYNHSFNQTHFAHFSLSTCTGNM